MGRTIALNNPKMPIANPMILCTAITCTICWIFTCVACGEEYWGTATNIRFGLWGACVEIAGFKSCGSYTNTPSEIIAAQAFSILAILVLLAATVMLFLSAFNPNIKIAMPAGIMLFVVVFFMWITMGSFWNKVTDLAPGG